MLGSCLSHLLLVVPPQPAWLQVDTATSSKGVSVDVFMALVGGWLEGALGVGCWLCISFSPAWGREFIILFGDYMVPRSLLFFACVQQARCLIQFLSTSYSDHSVVICQGYVRPSAMWFI